MSRVLITGAAGFLGARLARRMVQDGWEVVGLDLVPREYAWRLEGVKLEYRWGSCQDVHDLDVRWIFHCASQGDVPLGLSSPAYTISNNLGGTLALLEAAHRHDGLERFVLQSSEEVYGYQCRLPIREDQPLNPTNVYGCSKAAQELLVGAYRHSFGLPATVIRSSTIFGESMRETQVIPIFLQQALLGKPLTIHGDGRQSRDFHWVDDHIDAMITALTKPEAAGQIVNVGSGQERTVLSIAEDCIRVTGSNSPLKFLPQRPGEQGLRVVLDITRARELLDYRTKVSFEEGLERYCKWLSAKADRPLAATV
jgi:nucleoside-diphosphate-sugar epimerase